MKELGWKKSIVLVQPSDIFDLNSRDLVIEMKAYGLSRPEVLLVPDNTDFTDIIERIKELDVRILIGLLYVEKARQIICNFWNSGIGAPTYVWMLPGWYHDRDWFLQAHNTNCTESEMIEAVNGHFEFDFAQIRLDYENKILLTNKTVADVAAEFRHRISMPANMPVNKTFKSYSAYGYDAMLSIGLLLDKIVRNYSEQGMLDRINDFNYGYDDIVKLSNDFLSRKDFQFEGLTGVVRFYNLLSEDHEKREAEGHISINYVEASPNGRTTHFVAQYDNTQRKMTWLMPIPWTTNGGVQPVDSRPKTLVYSNQGVFVAIVVLTAIGITLLVGLLFFNIIWRHHWVLKNAMRLDDLVVLAAFASYTSIIVYGFDGQFYTFSDSSIVCCYLRSIFLSLSCTLFLGSLLTRTSAKALQRFVARQFEQLLVLCSTLTFGLLLTIDILLLILWSAIDPWKKEISVLEDDGRAIYIREKCSSANTWAYAFLFYKLIVVVVCAIAIVIRIKVVGKKSSVGSPYIDLLMCFLTFGLCLTIFAFTFITDPGEQYGLVSVGLLLLVTVLMCLWFIPKVHAILTGKKEDTANVNKDQHDPVVLTEVERTELRELRLRNTEQRDLLKSVILELPQSPTGQLADSVRSIMGYVPGQMLS
ncbi:gamma-aminobutyric acid type B receptor subunit 1-like isoform X2 [Corticium candelabrum]|nr:gamma-aminobutyric acid type B receptor subunit 1-like isoform X2 [Corticium candelabrum]